MLSLRAEIAACLLAVALLGLFAGWMMQRARGERRLHDAIAEWKQRCAELESSTQQDAENLEERLQSLAGEIRVLSAENRALRESARGDEKTLESARAEAIELNRRQAETQERLQRIIREREREIAALRAGGDGRATVVPLPDVRMPPREDIVAAVDGLDETIRIDPSQLPGGRSADAPLASDRAPQARAPEASSPPARDDGEPTFAETLDSTTDVGLLEAEEETMALDEETLALVRGLGSGSRK